MYLTVKQEVYQAATLLPLYMGGMFKKQDIMDIAEKRYLNLDHTDFNRDINSGVSAGRKAEEWAIFKSHQEGFVERIKVGYYKITNKGKHYIEDISAQIATVDRAEFDNEALLTDQAFGEFKSIYTKNESEILARQAHYINQLL